MMNPVLQEYLMSQSFREIASFKYISKGITDKETQRENVGGLLCLYGVFFSADMWELGHGEDGSLDMLSQDLEGLERDNVESIVVCQSF